MHVGCKSLHMESHRRAAVSTIVKKVNAGLQLAVYLCVYGKVPLLTPVHKLKVLTMSVGTGPRSQWMKGAWSTGGGGNIHTFMDTVFNNASGLFHQDSSTLQKWLRNSLRSTSTMC